MSLWVYFGSRTELSINNENILQALQIFLSVTLVPLKGQQLSRPLSIEGCELTYRLIMEFPAQEVKYKMLWMFACRYEWTFHHGVIGFCGSPTQRRTSPALHTVRSALQKVDMSHMRFIPAKRCFPSQRCIQLLSYCLYPLFLEHNAM